MHRNQKVSDKNTLNRKLSAAMQYMQKEGGNL